MMTQPSEIRPDILVFKTGLRHPGEVSRVAVLLESLDGILKWNVDLDDCDRVLRIEAVGLSCYDIIRLVSQAGFLCEELED